ncbi:hypothetical protein Bca52824_008718 [Brassica carinata]|uniref:Uncharacterized protein n=1 Tax=Brassica carinata TaxID=52824 RepID=A0A8X8B8E3_BRACI|nr:hypothetical protein Bca52824_008718 [Brassica carinata]
MEMRSRRRSMEALREKNSAVDGGGDIFGAFPAICRLFSPAMEEGVGIWRHMCLDVEV